MTIADTIIARTVVADSYDDNQNLQNQKQSPGGGIIGIKAGILDIPLTHAVVMKQIALTGGEFSTLGDSTNGAKDGQIIHIILVDNASGSNVYQVLITGYNTEAYSKLVFSTVGARATLMYLDTYGWFVLGLAGGAEFKQSGAPWT